MTIYIGINGFGRSWNNPAEIIHANDLSSVGVSRLFMVVDGFCAGGSDVVVRLACAS
jgi:hypothetical protein